MTGRPAAVLMYHAIVDDGQDPQGAELHYAVAHRVFAKHVDIARAAGLQPCSVRDCLSSPPDSAVAFTFDDGHVSNAWAAEVLHGVGGSGDFFVNSAHVGHPGFLDWPTLRNMADAGMSIQSHGHHHRYLDEMDATGVEDELRRSKQTIEDKLGHPVTLFAPPGGRISPGLVQISQRLGYVAVCSSRVGVWRGRPGEIPRFAVLRNSTEARVERWMVRHPREVLVSRVRHQVLRAGKGLLGNEAYDKLRAALLSKR